MHQINLVDETFDKNQSLHYNLSIQFGLNGLSFCLFDVIKNKFIAFRHYASTENRPEAISVIFEQDDMLSLTFKETFLLYDASPGTLIPAPLFDERNAEEYYKFNLGEDKFSSVHFNKLPESLLVNVFSIPEPIIRLLKKKFPKLAIYHRSSPFIESLIVESARWSQTKCYISIQQGILDVGLAHSKKLEFFNSFVYQEKTDIVYYILNVLEQFKLSPAFTEIYLSTNLDKHDEIFEYLGNFLTHVKFIKPSDKFTYSYIFDEFQLTRFANLFNLTLCV